ncbi:MAG: hypothetical protein [Incitativirus reperis]|uniref:Uncharacterized protein n=1 Tax=Cressdnaviricota sp. TaxID=2748378 RepID=A0A345MRT1_9VIRU|nr:MAG: hypothetical protein [Cressdnaviricota sp.]
MWYCHTKKKTIKCPMLADQPADQPTGVVPLHVKIPVPPVEIQTVQVIHGRRIVSVVPIQPQSSAKSPLSPQESTDQQSPGNKLDSCPLPKQCTSAFRGSGIFKATRPQQVPLQAQSTTGSIPSTIPIPPQEDTNQCSTTNSQGSTAHTSFTRARLNWNSQTPQQMDSS